MARIIDEYGRPKFDLEEFDIALKKLADKMEERDLEPFELNDRLKMVHCST